MKSIKSISRLTTVRNIDTELAKAPEGSVKARLLAQAKAMGITLEQFEECVYDTVAALTDADQVVGA